jgi:hypothetical protein
MGREDHHEHIEGVAYTESPRQDVLPLLQKSVGLENVEAAGKAYDAIGEMWPSDGLPSEQELGNAVSVAEISPTTRLDQLVSWGPLLKNGLRGLKSESSDR